MKLPIIKEFDADKDVTYKKVYNGINIKADYDQGRSSGSKWCATYTGELSRKLVFGATAAKAINEAIEKIDHAQRGEPEPTMEEMYPAKKVVTL